MKKIDELSEIEINNLSSDEIVLMIKLKKAQEGIKIIQKPKEPSYFDVKDPDALVYSCTLFGDSLVFKNIEELNKILIAIKDCSSKFRLDYDWNKADSSKKYLNRQLEKPYNGEWHLTSSQWVYSMELYNSMIDQIQQNKKLKEQYEKELKIYDESIHNAKWIEDEINEKVEEIKNKFLKLEDFCRKFKIDYLPLSNDNVNVAMKFMDKAYSLTDEQKNYILENYNN